MPDYKVSSGEMTVMVSTPLPAQPKMIVSMALSSVMEKGLRLGLLASVEGGEFTGDNEAYVSTELVLAEMGFMEKV